jgi:hypothetical protein
MELKIDTSEPAPLEKLTMKLSASPSYPGLNINLGYLIYSFRNSIGDLTPPNYDFWLLYNTEDEKNEASIMKLIKIDKLS